METLTVHDLTHTNTSADPDGLAAVPQAELDRLVLDVVEALELADKNQMDQAYWCLKLGEERARIFADRGYSWGEPLAERYQHALSDFCRCFLQPYVIN